MFKLLQPFRCQFIAASLQIRKQLRRTGNPNSDMQSIPCSSRWIKLFRQTSVQSHPIKNPVTSPLVKLRKLQTTCFWVSIRMHSVFQLNAYHTAACLIKMSVITAWI